MIGSMRVADHSLRQRSEQQVNPQMTFFQLAENIRDTAKNRAEEMLEAAEKPLAFR